MPFMYYDISDPKPSSCRGRNGLFRPAKVQVWQYKGDETITAAVMSSRPGVAPIWVALTPEDWRGLIATVQKVLAGEGEALFPDL